MTGENQHWPNNTYHQCHTSTQLNANNTSSATDQLAREIVDVGLISVEERRIDCGVSVTSFCRFDTCDNLKTNGEA
jgi:hypothetical protein